MLLKSSGVGALFGLGSEGFSNYLQKDFAEFFKRYWATSGKEPDCL